jgi:hypothetical protein
MNSLRFELVRICHRAGLDPKRVIEEAESYEKFILGGETVKMPPPKEDSSGKSIPKIKVKSDTSSILS